jgi:hypothetical protein
MILGKLSDVMSTNIDMLGAYIELWILGKCKSPLVISIDCCWLVLCKTELSEEVPDPDGFFASVG